jgi:SsrA-binding protein
MAKTERKAKFISSGVVAENRKARFNYAITETLEAGIALSGGEVKSLREGRASIADGYATPDPGGFVLNNVSIGKYGASDAFARIKERRARRLLLNSHEINRLVGVCSTKGATVVPLRL